jgi:hypothetical protein
MRLHPRLSKVGATGAALFAVALLQTTGLAVTASESGEHKSQHQPHHVLGVFIGDTTESRREGLTLGLEYEYRVSQRLGLGATIEHVAGDFDADVYVLPIALHNGPWKVYAGPGLERGEEGDAPLLRLGAEYGFHMGKFEISPQLDVDFVEDETLFVIGVVFAYLF